MVLFTSTQPTTAGQGVLGAIRNASQKTGVDFSYLVRTADRESALDPQAKASTSSATGLFQFIDQTWLQTVKEDGPILGLSSVADKINKTTSGQYVVDDPATRRSILDLRKDPDISAQMAAALTRRNHAHLSASLGREPSAGELYIAHFMGAGGATDFIRLVAGRPDSSAAAAFPQQARANPSIFFDRSGSALPAAAVYDKLVRTFGEGEGIAAEIAPLEVGQASELALANDSPLPGNPALWLAIPAHNAYVSETGIGGTGLARSEVASPISDAVVSHWADLPPMRLTDSFTAELATNLPLQSIGEPLDLAVINSSAADDVRALQDLPSVSLSQPTLAPQRSIIESFFSSLFSIQPAPAGSNG
jgi:hypothetical protein